MKLNITERFTISGVLPSINDFSTLKIVDEINRDTGFSESDHKKFNIRAHKTSEGIRTRWGAWSEEEIEEVRKKDKVKADQMEADNPEFAKHIGEIKEIEFGDKAKEIVKEALVVLDKEKKLTRDHFSLYEKFVQDKEE